MKNKLIIFVCVLLAFCLLAAAVKIGGSGTGNSLIVMDGSSGGGFNSGSEGESDNIVDPVVYSWVDPELGVDIFAYDNLFPFENNKSFSKSNCHGNESSVALTHTNGFFEIEVEGDAGFTLMPSYEFSSVYTYYFYISNNLMNGEELTFYRIPIGGADYNLLHIDIEGFNNESGTEKFKPTSNVRTGVNLCGYFEDGQYIFRVIGIWDYEGV